MFKKSIIFFNLLKKTTQLKFYSFVIFSILLGFLEMVGVGLIYPISNYIFSNNNEILQFIPFSKLLNNKSNSVIILILISSVLAIFFIKNVILILINYILYKILAEIRHDISCDFYKKYIHLNYSFYLEKNSGEITRNLTTLINELNSKIILPAGLLISELSVLLSILLLLFYINFLSSIILFSVFLFPMFIYYFFIRGTLDFQGKRAQRNESFRIDKINQLIGGIKEIKILSKEDYFIEKYTKFDKEVAYSNQIIQTFTQLNKYLLELLLIFSAISLFAVEFFTKSELNINSTLPLLSLYLMAAFKLLPSLNRINNAVQSIKWGGNVLQISADLLRKKTNNFLNHNITNSEFSFHNKISFKNIFFSYRNKKNIFSGLNFSIKKNSTIGITGESGSGKSTLINLMLGILSPSKGTIMIDDCDVHKEKYSLNSIIGYVPQDPYLSDSSVLNNVAFGVDDNSIDTSKVIECLKDAKIHEYVNSLKNGIYTKVGDRGIRLSGGQKQRLAIARSLYFGSQILIFDEATSSLDYKVEKEIMTTINNLNKKFTIIIIAHRLNTIKSCDIVYKLTNGKLKKVQYD